MKNDRINKELINKYNKKNRTSYDYQKQKKTDKHKNICDTHEDGA